MEIPNSYLAVAPIIIASPTPRCGTTLLQRLFCSSDNAFVYGEDLAHHVRTLTNFVIGIKQSFDATGAESDADIERALAGTLTDWRPGLMAPSAVMLKAWVEIYYQIPLALAAHGAKIGRPLWGFKRPDFTRDQLRAFLLLMPKAKVIYVYRRLEDALKSAKSRRFVNTDEEVAAFCARWAKNMAEALELRTDQRVLFVGYETLVATRDVQPLEAFTGATGMKPREFETKVNTFAGDEGSGHSPTQYIAPAPLTATDLASIRAHAGPMLDQLYGTVAA
jgi:hypothetical protein